MDHFGGADKMVEFGLESKRKVHDYKLSRFILLFVLTTQKLGWVLRN